MDERQKMIEKMSGLYREKLDGVNKIREEIQATKETMKNDLMLTHVEYFRLEVKLKSLETDYNNQLHIAQGVCEAREALFYDN